MPSKGCLITGIVLLVIGFLEIAVITFYPRILKRVRWGRSGDGPQVSRIGAAAMGVYVIAFGVTIILNGYFMVLSGFGVAMILLSNFILVLFTQFYDAFRENP